MIFVEPSVELINETDNFKRIERAGRISYKSEDKITDESALPFFQKMVKNGHTSTLEHSVIYIRSHEPGAYMKMQELLREYTEKTGYPHYIRYSQWDHDDTASQPNDPEFGEGYPLGICIGKEHLFSGNIRAWRKLCGAYAGETILCNLFYDHPAFHDIFVARDMKLYGKELGNEDKVYTEDMIEIVDSIPLDRDEFEYAYMHYPVTLKIIGDRGVIDEYCRHRSASPTVESTRYCVAGDTELKTSNPHNHITIEDLYNNRINSHNGSWKRYNFKVYNNKTGLFEYTHAKEVYYNGEKECIKITTRLGYTITCTKDHKLLSPGGFKDAEEFSIGDNICVNGTDLLYRSKDWLYHQNIDLNKTFVQIANEFGFNKSTLKKWARIHGIPKKGTGYFNIGRTPWNKGIQDSRQVEALKKYHHSGIHDDRKIIKSDTCKYQKHNNGVCSICGSINDLHVHHIDKNRENNNPNNLITLCASCHQRIHTNNLETIYNDTIVSIENAGVQKVYDISIDHECHNFIANGFIAHNCDYSKNGVTFVFPWWFTEMKDSPKYASLAGDFGNRCYDTELAYQEWMKKCGVPQMARGNLTFWVKSEGAFTATVQQWIDILKLRDAAGAHPDAQKIAKMIEKVLVEDVGIEDLWGVKEAEESND